MLLGSQNWPCFVKQLPTNLPSQSLALPKRNGCLNCVCGSGVVPGMSFSYLNAVRCVYRCVIWLKARFQLGFPKLPKLAPQCLKSAEVVKSRHPHLQITFTVMDLSYILDYKQVWSFFFKSRRISVSPHKAHNDYKRISGRSFQTRYRFSLDFWC